jgi:glycosyltransferase involved in cell wall biosynthesis
MKSQQEAGTYDFPFESDNVYGHALELLLRCKIIPRPGEIHLDIGCGFGGIAEKIQSELGRIYVGVDGSKDGLANLASRNFETHELWLEGRQETFRRLEEVIAGRPVGSISFLDTIEHVVDGDEILAAIGDIARAHLAPVVVSAPNVAHFDIGAKLAFGQWSYTVAGLLDHTHLRLFDRPLLLAALEKAGLPVVDHYDVVRPRSDQHFPSTHPALAAGTPLNGLLAEVARQSNPSLNVNQFVCLCVPSREMDRQTYTTIREEPRPLISAVIRTQGRRLHTLVETLTCFAGQTDPDFEIIVVGHKLDFQGLQDIQRIIEDSPEWLRQKIRFLREDGGGRSRPLNVGFAEARGRYIAIVDDDDIPMANWVAEFRKLDAKSPGRVLRCVAARQDVTNVEIGGKQGLRAEGPPEKIYPTTYNFIEHLVENRSPPITLAFPRGVFHDLRLRFDESLDTTEDWDFLLRASAYCGVAASPSIAGVYRWWVNHDSSRTLHSNEEWRKNHEAILRKQDESHFIIPKGGLAEIRKLVSSFVAPPKVIENGIDDRISSIEDAEFWGQRLSGKMPKDLARAVRRGLKRKCVSLKWRYYIAILNKRRRRDIRRQLGIYRRFLSEFH